MAQTVLIIEGDSSESQRLREILAGLGLKPQTIPIDRALDSRGLHEHAAPALAILDMEVPSLMAMPVLRLMKEQFDVPVIALIGPDRQSASEKAVKAGAADLLFKPVSPETVESAVRNLLKISALEHEITRMRSAQRGQVDFSTIIAVAPEMQRAKMLAQRAADLDLPLLLEGEPGTGKKLIAKAIHAASSRAGQPFSMLRFSASPNGIRKDHGEHALSLIERAWADAKGGVLFIEDAADLPLEAQAELAKRLADQSGGPADDFLSVRLICSSSKNLLEQVKTRRFRQDLYYLINVFPIWFPPLRDRKEDIPALSKHFLKQVIAEEGKPIEEISDGAMSLLQSYVWPGNIRQLETAIFRAVVLADGHSLTAQEFPQIAAQIPGASAGAAIHHETPSPMHYQGPAMIGGDLPSSRAIMLTSIPNRTRPGIPVLNEDGEIRRLEEIEADIIRLALGHYRGHITEVARRLGIGRSTLYRKMREFGLSVRHN
jgi:DNA-binding NtrC family response regulator